MRRKTGGSTSWRSTPSTPRYPAYATASARRCLAKSACNGGAMSSRRRTRAPGQGIRWRKRCSRPSSAAACRARHSRTISMRGYSISTTIRCRRATTSKVIAARRPPRSSSFRRSCSIRKRPPGHAELAGHAGCAQAITGLLRLLPLHRRRGQCYVPKDILAAAGTSPEEFLAGDGGPNARRAVAAMIALAREHLAAFERRCWQACRRRCARPFCRWR